MVLDGEQVRITPEFANVVQFLKMNSSDVGSWAQLVPQASQDVPRIVSSDRQQLVDALQQGEGRPVIIADAAQSWPALAWDVQHLRAVAGQAIVRVNDRAPARHADRLPGSGGPQQSVQVLFSRYIDYLEQLPSSLADYDPESPPPGTPFYLNGWRALMEYPALAADCPEPEFAAAVDDTVQLLKAIDSQIFKTEGSSPWCHQINDNLRKVFIGPCGTTTRLHFDAGEAHGWLAQVTGRKLFVLFPPSDGCHLAVLETEVETAQSPIDPLCPDVGRWPSYFHARPLACIVHPGEAVLIPQGWWHYAVALDRSITVQRNFYHAASNASGLVKMVLKTAQGLKQQGRS